MTSDDARRDSLGADEWPVHGFPFPRGETELVQKNVEGFPA
jgi:hypothetical protein